MKKVGVKDGVVVFLRCNTSQTETEGRRIEGLKKERKDYKRASQNEDE